MQTATRLNTTKNLNLLFGYLRSKIILAIVAAYFVLSVVLNLFFSIDVQIPCLWKSIFHMDCPGCGLTHATENLVALDPIAAYNTNPLIFILIPLLALVIVSDFRKFKRRSAN
jgi:hypothetical protein